MNRMPGSKGMFQIEYYLIYEEISIHIDVSIP